jgi:hypothetical protein
MLHFSRIFIQVTLCRVSIFRFNILRACEIEAKRNPFRLIFASICEIKREVFRFFSQNLAGAGGVGRNPSTGIRRPRLCDGHELIAVSGLSYRHQRWQMAVAPLIYLVSSNGAVLKPKWP